MRVSARPRGWCHPRGTPTGVTSRVLVVTMGTKAGATTDANDRDRRPPQYTAHFEPTADSTHGYLSRNATGGIEGHARGTHPSSSTESMLYMTAAIVYVAVDRARVG